MANIDPVKERERLRARYAAMSDLELQKVGRDPAELADWAFEALRAEMIKRGMEWAGNDMPLPSKMQKAEVAAGEGEGWKVKAAAEQGDAPMVVRRYRDMTQAMTDRMVLETASIDCYLYDENMVRLDWLWSNMLGGLKLVVRQKDAVDAEKLLSGSAIESFEVRGVGQYEQEHCPRCGSINVSCDELRKRLAVAGLWFGLPIAMTQRGWNCHACGHTWEAAKDGDASQTK